MILASKLTERVRIERPITVDDGYGGQTVTWQEVATVFAEVKAVFGAVSEHTVGAQRQADAGYRVIMRARTDISAVMRIVWKAHLLLVHSLHESETTLNILCYEENL